MVRLRWIIFDSFAALALLLCAAIGVTALLALMHHTNGLTLQFTRARLADLAARQMQISQNGDQLFARIAIEEFETDDNLKVLVPNQGRGGWRISSSNDKGWEQSAWLDFAQPGFHFKHADEQPGYGVARSRQWLVAMPAWSMMLLLSILPMTRVIVGLLQRGQRGSGGSLLARQPLRAATRVSRAPIFVRPQSRPRTAPSPLVISSPEWTRAPAPPSEEVLPPRRKAG